MKRRKEGILLVVSGPSGVGKGTVNEQLIKRNEDMKYSVSATTRDKRPGEIEGVHYYFKSREEFEGMIERNEFLEHMCVFGMNYYGTPRAYVEEELASGKDVILEIDVQGGMRIKEVCPDAVLIFIAPPSMGELKSRLIGRGTESPEVVERRIETALEEVKALPNYDYIIVNDIIEMAVHDIEDIISAEKSSMKRNKPLVDKLLEEIGR